MSNHQNHYTPRISFQYRISSDKKLSQTGDCQTSISKFNDLPSLEISMFSLNYSVKRVNQIQPKPKLIIPGRTQIKSQTSGNSESQSSPRKKQSMRYESINPTIFNWKKYTPLCGFQTKTGQNGCLCGNPCPLQKQWTRNYKQSDFKLYQKLMNEKISKQEEIQIQKDILRTHPECLTFSENQRYQQMLSQVLCSYSAYDPQIGYVQGMNLIVGTIVYHLKKSELAFWAFVDLMDEQQLRMIYLPGFKYLKLHQQKILSIMDDKVNDLIQKMNQLDIIPQSFLNGWILSLMGTCIPLEYMHFVIDKFIKFGWNYIYQLIITYLLFLKQSLMRSDDQSQFLESLNTKNSRQYGVIWEQLVQTAEKFPILPKDIAKS